MLNQIQELQLTEERVNKFTKPDMDIIEYIESKDRIELRELFKYITGIKTYDEDVEDELREMLKLYGYRLRKQCIARTINTWGDNPLRKTFINSSAWYYSISQHRRPGCYPCGIPINYEGMSRCYHWQKCHYGSVGKCQLALITMN